MMKSSRRTATVLSGILAAVLVSVTACGSSDSEESSGSSSTGSKGAFPAKVATKFGEVTVDEAPKRVVALGWGDAETALALGVQPVGASDWLPFGGEGVGPWAKGKYEKSPKLIGTLEPEYEKIAELQPDLILDVKSSGDRTRYDTLSKIAPTIGVPEGGDQYKVTWDKQTKMVSAALGLAEKGDKLISGVEKKFTEAKKAHPEFQGKTVTVGSRTSEGYGAYVRGTGRISFVESLGFKNSPAVQKKAGKAFSISVSKENVDLLDADLTVMTPIGVPARTITDDPLYQAVPSVKDGRDLFFPATVDKAFATDSVLSVSYAIDKVVPLLAGKLK